MVQHNLLKNMKIWFKYWETKKVMLRKLVSGEKWLGNNLRPYNIILIKISKKKRKEPKTSKYHRKTQNYQNQQEKQ